MSVKNNSSENTLSLHKIMNYENRFRTGTLSLPKTYLIK